MRCFKVLASSITCCTPRPALSTITRCSVIYPLSVPPCPLSVPLRAVAPYARAVHSKSERESAKAIKGAGGSESKEHESERRREQERARERGGGEGEEEGEREREGRGPRA
eukprot:3772140-Rhodomonas_salina.2